MFPRISKVTRGDKTYEYLKIVETYRENGKHRQRVVANLGRLDDALAGQIDQLTRALRRFGRDRLVAPEEIQARECLAWGPVLAARRLWEQMALDAIVSQHAKARQQKFDVAQCAFVLVANRLAEPSSELGLARWLEHTFVPRAHGRRWEPEWRAPHEVTKHQRVKVTHRWLNPWYRTLDALLRGKEQIERALYERVKDLFHLQVDMVFYDLTSTYFERRTPTGQMRRHGKSKDGRPRHVQVVVGVVMANGFPIAHHVFSGDTADKATLSHVLSDAQERFGLRRITVVADRGVVSSENMDWLAQHDVRYVVAIKGRRSKLAAQVFAALRDPPHAWGKVDEHNRAQLVQLPHDHARYVVVESEARLAYERDQRERSMARTREQLESIAKAVAAGRLKDPAKIGARAGRALSHDHGSRYFSYDVSGPGQFAFQQDPAKVEAERVREGRYILKTDVADFTPADAVDTYKQLSIVEDGFRDLKDVIEMRPVWHKSDARIEAHIFVATLALFLKRSLQHQLHAQGIGLSATDALSALKSVGLAELELDGKPHRLVSRPKGDAQRVLKALGITELQPAALSSARQAR